MACGDVLSLEDLQTAKKHQIFEAEVITGKAGGVAGGATIGTATNPVTGQTQQTLPSILADLGFDVQSWTSSTGGVLASANQVFLNDTHGSLGLGDYYAWGGTFPKTVPAGTDPALPTSGYIMRSSRLAGVQAREALRRDLASVGLNLVGGSFEEGASVVNGNDAVLLKSSGAAYIRKLGGAFTVTAGSAPDSSWVSVGSGLDDIYAFAFGLRPSATAEQNTIALCRALDIANGDYMQPVAHGNGTLARWLYGSVGTFATDPAFLTGVHAQAGKFVIRCNAQLRGRFPDAEFMIVHSRDIEVTHINAKSMEVRGAQGGDFRRWRLSGDLIIRASADRQPSWVYIWGGGTYWNEFANIKCGNTAVAGKIIFETSYGPVNANTLRRVSGQLLVTRYAGTVGSIFTECHENEIFGIDTSGSQGDPIRNDTPEGQLNTVYGWYDEVTGTGKVSGSWNIVYPKVQFNNWNTTQPEGWTIFTEPKANQQAGDFVPMTVESAATGSDWSVIEGSKGLPYCAKGNSIAQVYTDTAEPSGSGRSWGLDAAPVGSNFRFDLVVRSSKYVRGTIWIKDTPNLSITQIRVSNSDDTNALFQSVNKYVVRDGWRLYRVVGIVDPTKAVKVDFNASGDVRFGGAMFSRSHACALPLFPGWRKSHGIHDVQPTYLPPVAGFWFYRESTASAADPTVAWVRVTDTGSGTYMKINATF